MLNNCSMALFILCTFVLILFVLNSSLVISGASYGLMLWYKNVLPMLLPFMLISGIMVRAVNSISKKKHSCKKGYGILVTIFLGVLCGYPLGAKTCADFIKNDTFDSRIGNIILPLCNNSSPMFISGYIVYRILNKSIPLYEVLFFIYTPYILVTLISMLIYFHTNQKKSYDNKNITKKNATTSKETNINQYLINTVNQITLVGIYIMICSITIEFIMYIPYINPPFDTFLSGIIEITRGTSDIMHLHNITEKIKIALIISITSFGGISSILQTKMVIDNSGLSIFYYTIIKIVCATFSYITCMLLI